MKAFVVDDERLARDELRRLLSGHNDVEIVGEAGDLTTATACLAERPIDVVFLDVALPGCTGFDLLERLGRVPLVVFSTAYDEFAVRAFEVNALDYLLKPIHPQRLAESLERARLALRLGTSQTASTPDRLFFRDSGRTWLVRLADVVAFESEGNYTRLLIGEDRPLIRASLNDLEARLDPDAYIRISRRHVVNLRFVVKADGEGDALNLHLTNGQVARVSRRRARRLRGRFRL